MTEPSILLDVIKVSGITDDEVFDWEDRIKLLHPIAGTLKNLPDNGSGVVDTVGMIESGLANFDRFVTLSLELTAYGFPNRLIVFKQPVGNYVGAKYRCVNLSLEVDAELRAEHRMIDMVGAGNPYLIFEDRYEFDLETGRPVRKELDEPAHLNRLKSISLIQVASRMELHLYTYGTYFRYVTRTAVEDLPYGYDDYSNYLIKKDDTMTDDTETGDS